MEFNTCSTCGANNGRAGLLLNVPTLEGSNCLNCHDSLSTGVFTAHGSLSRTREEYDRMVAAMELIIASREVTRVLTSNKVDCAGRTLLLGQRVATYRPSASQSLSMATIIGFTEHTVEVEYKNDDTALRLPAQLCIVE